MRGLLRLVGSIRPGAGPLVTAFAGVLALWVCYGGSGPATGACLAPSGADQPEAAASGSDVSMEGPGLSPGPPPPRPEARLPEWLSELNFDTDSSKPCPSSGARARPYPSWLARRLHHPPASRPMFPHRSHLILFCTWVI